MSVLEATIFNTRAYTQDLKIVLYIALGSVCILMALYIYLVGGVVGSGFTQEKLREQLETLRAQVQNTEHVALQEGKSFTAEFFVSRGYYEPRALEAITRNRNVAEAPYNSNFY